MHRYRTNSIVAYNLRCFNLLECEVVLFDVVLAVPVDPPDLGLFLVFPRHVVKTFQFFWMTFPPTTTPPTPALVILTSKHDYIKAD